MKRGRPALHFFLGLLVAAAILCLLAGLLNFVVMPFITHKGQETVVPDVTGMNRFDAERALARAGLKVGNVKLVPSSAVLPDNVVAQYPRPGRKVKLGRRVDLDISTGAGKLVVPNVAGLPLARAMTVLADAGLVVTGVESLRTPGTQAGRVVAVRPASGTEVPQGSSVIVCVAARVGTFPMPNLVGMGLETAQGILASQGLVPGAVKTAASDEPVNTVLFQYPEEGMPVMEGDTVNLIVAQPRPGPQK